MLRKALVGTSILALTVLANAQFSAYVMPYYEGPLPDAGHYVFSFDLKVSVPEDDAWLVAGGPWVGEPWIELHGGEFYQDPFGRDIQPIPEMIPLYPDLEYDSFYTTHLGWPNTDNLGIPPSFAIDPVNEPTQLTVDWFWVPDGYTYPGEFTIARFTFVPHAPEWVVSIDMLVGSRQAGVIPFQDMVEGVYDEYCRGDLDGDRDVDLSDLAELLANYGTTSGATYWDGDLDGDDDVDIEDLGQLLSEYGAICP